MVYRAVDKSDQGWFRTPLLLRDSISTPIGRLFDIYMMDWSFNTPHIRFIRWRVHLKLACWYRYELHANGVREGISIWDPF